MIKPGQCLSRALVGEGTGSPKGWVVMADRCPSKKNGILRVE
jgi:hypothetical protein